MRASHMLIAGLLTSLSAITAPAARPVAWTPTDGPDRVAPSPLVDDGLDLEGQVVRLRFDAAAYRQIKRNARVHVASFPAAPRVWLDLELEQFFVTTPATRFARNALTPTAPPDVVLLRGTVAGEPDSRVFLGISPHGSNGYITLGERMYLVSTYAPDADAPADRVTHAFPADIAAPSEPWECVTHALPGLPSLNVQGGGPIAGGNQCLKAVVAIETDYQYYQRYNDEGRANAYIVQIVGAASDVYERDTGIQLVIGFSRLWTDPDDPWTDSTSQSIYEFRDYWNANMRHIQRTSVHFLSGKRGGGVAYYPGLCYPEYDYALSHVNGSFPLPLRSNHPGNWDMHVVPHEWGHIFGSLHTHDGYDPPIDRCAYDCGDGQPRQGTIMSYCHLCTGGERNIVLEFHARVRAVIIAHTASTGCVTEPVDCDHPIRGDVNCDGIINSFDIEAFILGLFDRAEYDRRWPACDVVVLGDTNGDGFFNAQDIDSFIELLFN